MNTNAIHVNKWFVCARTNREADMRFFLFPYAGGGPAAFHPWISRLPVALEAWIAHYPGRGSRLHESPIRQIDTLTDHLFQAIGALLDKPFAFFGHSLGALLAFELTRHLHRNGLPLPGILWASGCGAPHLNHTLPPSHDLPETEFLGALKRLNGIPADLLDQPEVLQLLLPAVRADLEAAEKYVFSPAEPRLNVPIVALGSLADPRVNREQIEGWSVHTSAGFHSQYFPGDHFFIHTDRDAVIAAVTAVLQLIDEKH